MKTCSKCGSHKDLSKFSAKKRNKDGRRSHCKACVKVDAAEYRNQNRDKINAHNKAWQAQNKEKKAAYDKAYRAKNKEVAREASRARYEKNKDKVSARQKAFRAENRHKVNAYAAKRRSSTSQRTPKWLTQQDFDVIEFMYAWAKVLEAETGVPHHVDHIYPLRGRYVSGLHVPANLQVLTASENLSKNNRWNPI